MTTEEQAKEVGDVPAETDERPEILPASTKSRPLTVFFVLVSLIISVIAAGIAAYNYKSINQVRSSTELTTRLDQYQHSLDQITASISSLQSQQQQLEGDLDRMLEEQQRNAQSIQALYDDQNRDDTNWSLAETEHLIQIAGLRLSLENDRDTAMVALQEADNRLASLGDPGLFNVRRLLTAEMNALRSVETVDITGLSLYLTDMASRVKSLPLKAGAVAETLNPGVVIDTDLPAWKQLLFKLWYEFKGMFTITRTGDNASATLLPDEKYFLYQNLRLQLETARLAVIRRDTGNLRESLALIQTWLGEYFDTRDSGVMNIMQATENMSGLELDPALPGIGASLEALRNYVNSRSRGTPEAGTDLP